MPNGKLTGVTPETYKRLLYDAGIVYLNYGLPGQKILGATRGGNTCTIEPNIRKMPVDGVTEYDVKGDKRIIGGSYKLSVNLIEMSTDALLANLTASTNTPNGTHDVITRDGQIAEGDYFSNVTLVLQKNGTSALFGFKLFNAIAMGPLEIGASDNDEPVNTIEFTGHINPSDLSKEPWEIFNPLEVATVFYTLTYIAGANGSIIGNTSQTVSAGSNGSSVYANPAPLYEFVNWSDASVANPRTEMAVAGNVSVTANFALI
jgi:hypothetical protein